MCNKMAPQLFEVEVIVVCCFPGPCDVDHDSFEVFVGITRRISDFAIDWTMLRPLESHDPRMPGLLL